MGKRANPVSGSFFGTMACSLAILLCAILYVRDTRAQATQRDLIYGMELGVGAGNGTAVPPGSNAEFGKLTVTRPDDWSASGLFGRVERFNDISLDYGGSFTKTLQSGVDATVALSSGTGEFIAPRYRFDASLRTALLLPDRTLVATGGFRRIQSKGVNSSDGLNAGLIWYYASHWMFSGGVEADRGYPGSAISTLYSASATHYEYKQWYIGATVRQGHAAYNIIGPNLTLVDYPTRSLTVSGSWWWNQRDALTVDAAYVDNSFYNDRNITVRWYHEFR